MSTNKFAGLPIVFIHTGKSWFLPCVLSQARSSNPRSEITLIGTNSNFRRYCNFYHIEDFNGSACRFEDKYQHFSTNPYLFELVCIQRWFILLEWMRQRNHDVCFYIDSDVLLYTDVTEDFINHSNSSLTWVGHLAEVINRIHGPIQGFVKRDELERFCVFIFDFYQDEVNIIRARELYNMCEAEGGGVSDMALFDWFREQNPGMFENISLVKNGALYDCNVSSSDGFVMGDGIKKIRFESGFPIGIQVSSGKEIRFKSLHFQGSAKSKIPSFARPRNMISLMAFIMAHFPDRVRRML